VSAYDFSIVALFAALDARRDARGMSWQQIAREISAPFEKCPAKPVSASTLRALCTRESVEGDGVLQMLLWLDRTPESFVADFNGIESNEASLRRAEPHQILRFDATAMHARLDARRIEQALTWAQVADAVGGINAPGLTRLAKGGRVAFPQVMRITRWLRSPAAAFTRASDG
jgi:transcriptional regulator with XRE-family HTH domain